MFPLPPRPPRNRAFTLVELLVSMAVLTMLLVLITQLFNATSLVTGMGNKRMDADAQARALLDRMALDLGKIVRRADVDYYLKGRPAANSQAGNDQIAFYTEAPGYYPEQATGITTQSPVSLVAYRLPADQVTPPDFRLQRLGKGLVWNGVSAAKVPATNVPMVFLPVPIATPLPSPAPASTPAPAWPQAGNMDDDPNGDYEFIGPQVFRFEYYYVLKGQDVTTNPSILSDTPWDTRPPLSHTSVEGLRDVAAIGVAIAVIDPKSRVLVSDEQLTTLAGQMEDFAASMSPGDLEAQWQAAVTAGALPRVAASAIRIYGRVFYFNPTP